VILFTADWHLKLGQKNVPLPWACSRFELFFEEIRKIERYAEMHIIGGDLFDRVPTMDELTLYFDFIKDVSIPTYIFDGNHEATKKNKTFFSNIKRATQNVNNLVTIVDETTEFEWGTILPYCDLHKKGSIEACNPEKLLFTHVRGEIPPHVTPEVDLDRFLPFPHVFAGDLHAHSNTQRNIIYPGSPMTTSFHREIVKTGHIQILNSNYWEWHEFELPQLLRKTITSEDEMIATDYHHTIYEIEGDVADLASVKNSELLDKKVVKRSSESTLNLKDMTIDEELIEYFKTILSLPEDKIQNIMAVFNDYSKNATMG